MIAKVVIATRWPNISFGFQLRDVCQVPGALQGMENAQIHSHIARSVQTQISTELLIELKELGANVPVYRGRY